jgi:hypothetical protein
MNWEGFGRKRSWPNRGTMPGATEVTTKPSGPTVSDIQKLLVWASQAHRQHRDRISLLQESRLKATSNIISVFSQLTLF